MGLGSPSVLLAWRSPGPTVLAADIGSLIQNPAVLLGAAAVVVIAVLIVLIMVLRGGGKKADLASESEEDQRAWEESAPRNVPNYSARSQGQDSREQMLPWEQGSGRAESGRPSLSGKRGPADRDAQPGWGQADQGAQQWQPQGQPAPRGGGQWVGTDEWVPPEVAGARGNADPRGQGQMGPGPRENEGWPWAAGQAAQGGPPADQWGQPAASPMGPAGDQWGQGPANARPMGRENDQWGQAPAAPYAAGPGRGDDQWGQAPAAPTGRGDDQWGQRPGNSHPAGREQDQWGQGASAPGRGRGQDQWGGQPASNGYGAGQPEDQGFDPRGGPPRRGAEPAAQADGQWGQGNWPQQNAGWNNAEPASPWGQGAPPPAQPPQSARPVQPGNSRPNSQGGLGGLGNTPQSAPDVGSGWGEREAPAWQVDPRKEPPAWEAPSWQSPEPEQPKSRSAPRPPPPRSRNGNSQAGARVSQPGRVQRPPASGGNLNRPRAQAQAAPSSQRAREA